MQGVKISRSARNDGHGGTEMTGVGTRLEMTRDLCRTALGDREQKQTAPLPYMISAKSLTITHYSDIYEETFPRSGLRLRSLNT